MKRKLLRRGCTLTLLLAAMVMMKEHTVMPRPEKINLQIQSVGENQFGLIVDGKLLPPEMSAVYMEEEYYVPLDAVDAYISDDLFYDREAKLVTYTDYNNVLKMNIDARLADLNGKSEILEAGMKLIEDRVYVPYSFMEEKWSVQLTKSPHLPLLVLDTFRDTQLRGKTVVNVPLYQQAKGEEKPFVYLNSMEDARVFEDENSNANFAKVVLKDGLSGYVERNKITNIMESKGPKVQMTPPVREDKVIMGWHQVFNRTASKRTDKVEAAKGIEVVSPTWFAFANDKGDVKSIANKEYVDWAHARGIQVWALINDFSSDTNVDAAIFMNPEKRQYVIDQLLEYCRVYDLDGINIDFEKVPKEVGPYFVQFMRELSPALRNAGIVVSVDVYVPSAWTAHYRRDILGEFVDYVIIMGYDEHWGGGPESGSVSSIGFVESAIRKTLELVPSHKVILGVPYYTRLWQEQAVGDNKIKLSSKAYGMESAFNKLQENGVGVEWLEEVGQFYGEYAKGDSQYKVWLEDERSMEGRLKKAVEYDLAGVAAWKLGLEKASIWPLISKYID